MESGIHDIKNFTKGLLIVIKELLRLLHRLNIQAMKLIPIQLYLVQILRQFKDGISLSPPIRPLPHRLQIQNRILRDGAVFMAVEPVGEILCLFIGIIEF